MLLAIDSLDLSTQWQMLEEEGHTGIEQIEEITLRLLVIDKRVLILATKAGHTKLELRVAIEVRTE